MKKWRLEIFQKRFQAVVNNLDYSRSHYKSLSESIENYYTTCRNIILTGVSFTAPLILGLGAFQVDQRSILPQFLILPLLMLVLVVGIIGPIILALMKGNVQGQMQKMDASFFSAKIVVHGFMTHVINVSYSLEFIDGDRIDLFYELGAPVAVGAAAIELNKQAKNMLSSKLLCGIGAFQRFPPFKRVREDLEKDSKNMSKDIQEGRTAYEKHRNNINYQKKYKADLADFDEKFFKGFVDFIKEQQQIKASKEAQQQ